MDPFSDIPLDLPTPQQEIDSVNAREELLLKAREVSRRIAARFWKAMDGHTTPPADGQARSAR